mgnify:CR=1 FL=1
MKVKFMDRVRVEWGVIIVLLLILFFSVKSCNNHKTKEQEQIELVEALNDTLKTWKDKDSLSHAKIQVIETYNPKDFINIKSNDKEVQELQKVVKTYQDKLNKQGSVTIFNSNTNIDTKVPTKVDTIYVPKDGLVVKKTVYNSSFNLGGWVVGTTKATEDSTQVSLKVKNEYSVIIGEESQGWFKPKKPFVEVINKNPYSETDKLRTYQVQTPAVKRFGIGPFVGYGIGSNFNAGVFVGVGLQYNLIKF